MVTGLQMYDALKDKTRCLPAGASFVINSLDVLDLGKLTESDLCARGYDPEVAKDVADSLLKSDIQPLAKSMGIKLSHSHVAQGLLADIKAEQNAEPELPMTGF